MASQAEPAGRPILPARLRGLDGVLLLLLVGLLAWSAIDDLIRALDFAALAPSFDLVFDTIGLFTTFGVASLAWLRYLENGTTIHLFQASAFLVLATSSAIHLIVLTGNPAVTAGISLADQGQAPLYAFAAGRLTASILLVIGSTAFTGGRRPHSATVVLVVPTMVVLAVVLAARLRPDLLPSLGSLSTGTDGQTADVPSATGLEAGINGVTAALFLVAAGLSRRLVRRSANVGEAYLAVGLLLAAGAEIDGMFDPSYAGLVNDADLLRLAFYAVLLLGLTAEAVVTMRSLKQSRDDLTRLRDLEVERAALDERSRLSRELHDGLAQQLWAAKLKAARLASASDLPVGLRSLAAEVSGAVDAGLEEARLVVTTLRLAVDRASTVNALLARAVDDFEDRFGIRAEFECPSEIPRLPVRTEAELLRIAQEALSNISRHADATVVRVRAMADAAGLSLSIRDNGRGFDPAAIPEGHFGVASMRERAALISAELSIESRPDGGTTVLVRVPVPPAPPTAAGPAA